MGDRVGRHSSLVIAAIAAFLFLSFVHQSNAAAVEGRRVLLSDVKTISLTQGHTTAGRRHHGIPQLKCVGGPCRDWTPTTVRCHNRGTDGIDAQWDCEADMPGHLNFGSIEVVCEGYDYPDDKYVLHNSCGLEYTLVRDGETGKARYQPSASSAATSSSGGDGFFTRLSNLFWIVLSVAVFVTVIKCLFRSRGVSAATHGGGDYSDAYHNAAGPGAVGYGHGMSGDPRASPAASSGPGFWSGVAAGGVAGYMAGNRRSQPAAAAATTHSGSSAAAAPAATQTVHRTAAGGTKRR